jgi:DNA (cytosine-5)-methyltransferase 1
MNTIGTQQMTRPKLLDLFCGQGGAAHGYHQAGFDVLGVDINPQPLYPYDFIQANAIDMLKDKAFIAQFAAAHASCPCQFGSVITPDKSLHHNFIPETRELFKQSGKLYVIENVEGSRKHLAPNSLMLCGSMFGLPIFRHRYFEMNVPIGKLWQPCKHTFKPVYITGSQKHHGKVSAKDPTNTERRLALDCSWMSGSGLDEAIPPAYTKYIGEHLLQFIKV